jgi:hypothetical protein
MREGFRFFFFFLMSGIFSGNKRKWKEIRRQREVTDGMESSWRSVQEVDEIRDH